MSTSFGCIKRMCEDGKLGDAISAAKKMQQLENKVSNKVFFYLLRDCTFNGSIRAGREVFHLIVRGRLESNAYLGSQLIEMYTAFRSLSEANEVFNRLNDPNIFCWSAIVLANVKLGCAEKAMVLYEQMMLSMLKADGHLFVAIIKACIDSGAVVRGKSIHVRAYNTLTIYEDTFLGNALVNMYSKFGHLQDAYFVFESLLERDLVAWTAIITGHIQLCQGHEAMRIVFRLYAEGIEPDDVTFACILKACSCNGAEDCGDVTYSHVLENTQELGAYSGSAIIHLYFNCGRFEDACKVFDRLQNRCTSAVWNTMIAGYAMHGHVDKVASLLRCMQIRGVDPDRITYVNVLSAELSRTNSNDLKQITEYITENGFDSDAVVTSALVHRHSNQGFLKDAFRMFDKMVKKDIVSWSTIIGCYATHWCNDQALTSFQEMQEDGLQPNEITLLSGLKACLNVAALNQGRLVHHTAVEHSCESNLYVGTMLIDLYGRCKSLRDSFHVFDHIPQRDSVTWNAIGLGYALSNCLSETLQCLYGMQLQGLTANHSTFACILMACSNLGFLACYGQALHLMQVQSTSLSLHSYNCMLDYLGRCGHLQKSNDLLHVIPASENKIGCRSLLSHLRTYSNSVLGKKCFLQMMAIDCR